MDSVKEEADLRTRDSVEDLFKGGAALKISRAHSSKLIPDIVQAFTVRSALVNFRPLGIDYGRPAAHLYECWPDAAERLFRPCPFCVTAVEQDDDDSPYGRVTDCYHIRNAVSGQQLTVKVSQRCVRRNGDWTRIPRIVSARIFVDDGVQCRPELPRRPQRALALPHQEDPLLGVFGFASRDELDALQLTRRFWRDVVDNAAGTLALRPLQFVRIDSEGVTIETPDSEAMPGARFDVRWNQIPSYRPAEFRPEDVPIVIGLLHRACALRYFAKAWDMDHFRAVTQHLADNGRPFRAKSVALEFLDDEEEEIITSLQLVADMGAKYFELRVNGEVAPLIFDIEALLSVNHLRLLIEDRYSAATEAELSDIQDHCNAYLQRAVGCHVSFLQLGSYALFSVDHVIERFLGASRHDNFSMPLSLYMYVASAPPGSLKPASCKYPTLRDVAIPHKVLPSRADEDDKKLTCDVFHFHNPRTDGQLTVCLGQDSQGIVRRVFLLKGRILTSPEDIAQMEPFSYE